MSDEYVLNGDAMLMSVWHELLNFYWDDEISVLVLDRLQDVLSAHVNETGRQQMDIVRKWVTE